MALFVIYFFFSHVKETLRFSLTRHSSTWWTVGGARTTWVRETKFGTASLERFTSTNCTTGYLVICTTFLLLRERCDALPWNAKRPLFTDTRLRNMVALPVWFSNPLSSQTVAGGAKHHQTSDYLTFLFSFYTNIYNTFYFWDHEYFFLLSQKCICRCFHTLRWTVRLPQKVTQVCEVLLTADIIV